MATILLAAAGAAAGAGFGGTVLGLSGAVIGRAVGATLGRVIDQRLMGGGSRVIETGKVDRLRLSGASEGAPVGIVWGRMRVAGQVIWATHFRQTVATSGGGKGMPKPKTRSYSYSVSLAIALCEGRISRIGRVWADGVEIAASSLNMRVYDGSDDQLPDPKMEAVEGAGRVPAYRGIAYVVLEDLDLTPFGNRVPQFSFEVMRRAQGAAVAQIPEIGRDLRGVALIPGTGEYALATTPVHADRGLGARRSINVNTPAGGTDLSVALAALREELPACMSVSLVVSWFGGDLRAGQCRVEPKVEDRETVASLPWRAGGIGRAEAAEVPRVDGRSIYGGTPSDASVIEAIRALRESGQEAVFYPFLLMDQLAGNGKADPWTGAPDQPPLPWRGRITTAVAPGRPGTTDRMAAAAAEVGAFFGTAARSDFQVSGGTVSYTGPQEWSYRRFILHYAHLCAAAGGIGAFCIGSELRSLTQIRGANDSFPAVAQLKALAADVRAILGAGVRIGYAADWSEYRGYDVGGGDFHFHLDPLWADPNIDFVGIDNYMPLSDWREGDAHLDGAGGQSIYDLDYLQSNIEGGEGFDWYYASAADRAAQIRTPITDGAFGEPWIWRIKDVRSWWSNPHRSRVNGVQQAPTPWVPRSKPIWFTEFGCAAIDKGTNEPNKFLDPKSSESALPYGSDGRRDDLIQMQYLRAFLGYWSGAGKNPVSPVYGGAMVDLGRAHAWAWDARPYPWFPGNAALWSDGGNYARGHWLNGRVTAQPLGSVVAEICARAGLADTDVSGLYGMVRGYSVADVGPARAALQPLMLAYGFEASERQGRIVFRMRDARPMHDLGPDDLAETEKGQGGPEAQRAAEAEMAGRVRLTYVEAEGDYEGRAVEAIFPDEETHGVSQSEMPLALTRSEGQRIVERWLSEARVARDAITLSVPPSKGHVDAGEVIRFKGASYRVDRIERAGAITLEAVRVERGIYRTPEESDDVVAPRAFLAPVPVFPLFLDLPLLSGDEVPQAPHLAVAAEPWPGGASLWSSDQDADYAFNTEILRPSIIGTTLTPLPAARAGVLDRGQPLRVRIGAGALSSVSPDQMLVGGNLLAIGDGSTGNWEVMQFATATLVAPGIYDLGLRLRGQAGTDAAMPAVWPAGSHVVRLDGGPVQIGMPSNQRGLVRHYRIGPAGRSYDDPSYLHRQVGFVGLGLQPLSPCHLRCRRQGADLALRWIRRTRIGGDNWDGFDVPLGEASEAYVLRIMQGTEVRREVIVSVAHWTYSATDRAADGVAAPFELHVAQVSESFGPGPFARMTIHE